MFLVAAHPWFHQKGLVFMILSHVSKGLVISGVLLSIYNADLDLYKNPSKIIELIEVSGENSPCLDNFQSSKLDVNHVQPWRVMGGEEELFNSNSYKLLDISDENLKRENLPPVLDIWKYRVMTSETGETSTSMVISCNFQAICRLGHQRFIKAEWLTTFPKTLGSLTT